MIRLTNNLLIPLFRDLGINTNGCERLTKAMGTSKLSVDVDISFQAAGDMFGYLARDLSQGHRIV